MSWTPIRTSDGDRVEYKVTDNKLLLVRDPGQTTEYPHFSVKLRDDGEIDPISYHTSEGRFGSRYGMNEVIVEVIVMVNK